MAELDPEKVGRSGVDPVTGSVLSQEVRTALLKKSTIDASVFQNIENRRTQTDAQNAELSRGQEQALLGFNSTLQAIRTDIVKLGTGLSGIALLLQQDAVEDQSKIRTDQEKQRLLAERQVRIGKESDIEQKIQNAVAEPVQKLVPKVDDIFGKIGAALGILFGGWLTNQTVQAIQASEEGNTKLFNDIRFNILKNIGIAVGGLFAIKAGFSLIMRTIGAIASGLTKLFIAKPLAIAAGLLRIKTPKVTGPGPGLKTGGGKKFFGLGSLVNLVFGGLDFFQRKKEGQTNLQAGVGAAGGVAGAETGAAIGSKFPGILKFPATLTLGVAGYMLGGKGVDILTGVNKPKASPKPTPVPVAPTAQPQTPMMGDQTPSTPPPAPTEMEKKFEQAWQNRNNPVVRGRIEDTWNEMTPNQQQQAKTWASSKGYDWNEMKLKDAVDMSDLKQQPSKTETAEISPAQVSMPLREPQQVGQLPEPKPSLTMIKTSNNQSQQVIPPLTNEPLTDVPLINSANPDNFYVLYSQLNYNVVM